MKKPWIGSAHYLGTYHYVSNFLYTPDTADTRPQPNLVVNDDGSVQRNRSAVAGGTGAPIKSC